MPRVNRLFFGDYFNAVITVPIPRCRMRSGSNPRLANRVGSLFSKHSSNNCARRYPIARDMRSMTGERAEPPNAEPPPRGATGCVESSIKRRRETPC